MGLHERTYIHIADSFSGNDTWARQAHRDLAAGMLDKVSWMHFGGYVG
jgi:hypothetical protein